MYRIIPEKIIKSAADHMRSEDPLNNFHFLLEEGEIYKDADLTPVYLYNELTKEMVVTTRECMSGRYH